MAKILLVFGTTEGHTTKIAQRMAEAMRGAGHEVEVHDSKDARQVTLAPDYDGVLVGGSVHAGEHQSSLREFVKDHHALLDRVPSAFFSVSLSAANSDDESEAETQAMVEKFTRETGWQPARTERIAGALVYTQYNIFIRQLMKLIAKGEGRAELDTSRDYDFTDWPTVEAFARDFAGSIVRAPTA